MAAFIFGSQELTREIENSPHLAGELRFLESITRPGMRVIEAGGNRGVTAVAIAEAIGAGGHLDIFEPVPEFYDDLVANLERNGARNATAHRLALSDRSGAIRFYKHGDGSGVTPAEGSEAIRVEATTVEGFAAERGLEGLDLLNLDCEGSELRVFAGARAVLEKYGPEVFCEIHHEYLEQLQESVFDVVSFLVELGYWVSGVRVEEADAAPGFKDCSHIYASRRGRITPSS